MHTQILEVSRLRTNRNAAPFSSNEKRYKIFNFRAKLKKIFPRTFSRCLHVQKGEGKEKENGFWAFNCCMFQSGMVPSCCGCSVFFTYLLHYDDYRANCCYHSPKQTTCEHQRTNGQHWRSCFLYFIDGISFSFFLSFLSLLFIHKCRLISYLFFLFTSPFIFCHSSS